MTLLDIELQNRKAVIKPDDIAKASMLSINAHELAVDLRIVSEAYLSLKEEYENISKSN